MSQVRRFRRFTWIVCALLAIDGWVGIQSAYAQRVNDDLFTVHAVQYLLDIWPADFSNSGAVVNQLREIDKTVSAMKAAAELRKADAAVMGVLDDCRARVIAYESYLREVGAINRDTRIAADAHNAQSAVTAFKVGTDAASTASSNGYSDKDSAVVGLAAGAVAGLFDNYMKQQQRAADERSRIDAAAGALRRVCDDLTVRSKLRVEQLTTAKNWARGEAGLDGFTSRSLGDLMNHRPKDLFLRVRNASIRQDNETADAVLKDAETCVEAAELVPASGAFDEFRAIFLSCATEAAAQAAVQSLPGESYSNGPTSQARQAVKIVQKYLGQPRADNQFGNFHLARVLAASGDVSGAINAANKLTKENHTKT